MAIFLQVREIESEEELDTLLASDDRLTILLAGGLTAHVFPQEHGNLASASAPASAAHVWSLS